MFAAIASVLQLIVQPCYDLVGNWWIAILLFTLITKAILMPMALWVQWNSIKMVQIMPAINRLKVYSGAEHPHAAQKPEAWTQD